MTKDSEPGFILRVVLAALHILIGLFFWSFILRYLLARPHLDLATMLAVGSFALACGIVMRRPWATWLHVALLGVVVAIGINGAVVAEYGPSLGGPQELNLSMLVWAIGPPYFYPVVMLLGLAEAGSLVLLIVTNWSERQESLRILHPLLASVSNNTKAAPPKPRPRFIHLWEVAAILPLTFIIFIGDWCVPTIANANLRSFRQRQDEVELKEKQIAAAEAKNEQDLAIKLESANREIKNLTKTRKKLESGDIADGDLRRNVALRTQKIAEIDRMLNSRREEKSKCEKGLADLKQQRAKRIEENQKYISTGRR